MVFADPLWFEAFGSRHIVFRHERCRAIRQIYQSFFLPTLDDSHCFLLGSPGTLEHGNVYNPTVYSDIEIWHSWVHNFTSANFKGCWMTLTVFCWEV